MAHKKIFVENSEIKPKGTKLSELLSWFKGWKLYMTYPIRNAGLGLAFLFMTVLGSDYITYGFCLQQCVPESILGALIGLSAIVGVSGSVTFPFLRKYIGLAKTGIFGMLSLVSCLSLCVVSIFLEGSPFNANYFQLQRLVSVLCTKCIIYFENNIQKNTLNNSVIPNTLNVSLKSCFIIFCLITLSTLVCLVQKFIF